MNCVVLHESNHQIRIQIPQIRMSLREADLVEYYMKSIPEVKDVSVNERTNHAVITFFGSSKEGKKAVLEALRSFHYQDEKVQSLVPEETGRAMNRAYEEKIITKLGMRLFNKIFLPVPIATAWCVVKSVPFIVHGIKTLLHGKLEVSVLDATAIGASMLIGDFTTASSVMFLLEIGDTLEEWTRKKTVGDLARSMSLCIDKVWLQTDQEEVLVGIHQIQVGDHIIVRNSNIIPLDGKVISGEMTVNQSSMTGESEPVFKTIGGYVYAGTIVEEGECIIEVSKLAGNGRYDQIVHMIEESQKLNSQTESRAYRLADQLVPYSFAGAIAGFLLTRNITKSLSFLMVDYSCAMKLSMPLAVLSAMREARDHNISIKGGKYMEAIAEADTIVFDKTGTLTHSTPELVDVVTFGGQNPDEMLRIAACLEEHYPHSVANAIVEGAAKKGLTHEELHSKVEYIVAHGVSSYINGKRAVIGSYHFVMEDEHSEITEDELEKLKGIPNEYSRIFLAIGGKLVAVLCIFDPVKEDAQEVISKLHALGITKICMMTGDNRKTAEVVAHKLGIDEYYAEVLPEDKAAFIQREHKAGHKVIMVGDGVNDTPALSEADVGISIAEGAAIAREVADVTIASDDLARLITLRQISQGLMKRIRHNYRFIISFNTTLIGLGFFGLITPSTSALLHNGSTIVTGVKSLTNILEDIDRTS